MARGQIHYWKVLLKVHATVGHTLTGTSEVQSWTCVYNVKAYNKAMAQQLVQGDVPEGVVIDEVTAMECTKKDFKGVIDFDEREDARSRLRPTFGDRS